MNKAVVLGSNYYIGLSVIRCLGKKGIEVIAFDYSKEGTYGAASKYLSSQRIVPHYKDEEELLEYLLAYGKKEDVKPVLHPTADAYVEFMDKYLHELKNYYLFPMTQKGLWQRVMDKDGIRALCNTHNVLVPETINAQDYNADLVEKRIGYPCLLKPRRSPEFVSHYRKKMFVCDNQESLEDSLQITSADGFDMLIQRKILGPDSNVYTYDAYLSQASKVTHSTTCQKLRQFPINFGASSYTKHNQIDMLSKIGSDFLEAIGYKGFAEIEFKKDIRNHHYYLIEVNTRTTTLNCLLERIGLNFPYIAYREMSGYSLEDKTNVKTRPYAFRYHIEDLISIKNYISSNQMSLMDYIKEKKYKTVHAIWSRDDIKPYITYMIQKLLRKRNN